MRNVTRASIVLFVGAILAACSAGDGASENADSSNTELGTIPNHLYAALCANEDRAGRTMT